MWRQLAVIGSLSLVSVSSFAASSCHINIENEFHIKDEKVSIYVEGKQKVLFDDDEVFLDGKELDLNRSQAKAADAYRSQIATQIPRTKALAEEALDVADGVIDDVGDTFEAQGEFDSLKLLVRDFYQDMEARYYQNDEWILQKDAINQAILNWPADMQSALNRFNNQAITAALGAIAKQMEEGGALNLMKLQAQAYTLSTKLEERFKDDSKGLEKQARQLCSDVQNISQYETTLHQQIPQLKAYPIFTTNTATQTAQ